MYIMTGKQNCSFYLPMDNIPAKLMLWAGQEFKTDKYDISKMVLICTDSFAMALKNFKILSRQELGSIYDCINIQDDKDKELYKKHQEEMNSYGIYKEISSTDDLYSIFNSFVKDSDSLMCSSNISDIEKFGSFKTLKYLFSLRDYFINSHIIHMLIENLQLSRCEWHSISLLSILITDWEKITEYDSKDAGCLDKIVKIFIDSYQNGKIQDYISKQD